VIVAARCQKAFFTELAAPEPNVEKLTHEGVVCADTPAYCIDRKS